MLDIEYKGGNTVVLATKKTTLVADPKTSIVGLKDTLIKGAIELSTEPRFALNSPDVQLVIEGPGEYEVGDFSITGVSTLRHIDTETDEKIATIYKLEIGDIRIALFGNIAPKLTEDQLEEIGVVDMVILPVGGNGYTLDATSAVGIIRQVDPKAVIPIHYEDGAVKYEVPQDPLEVFVKELGATKEEAVSKYKVKAVSALPQTLTIVEITRS